MAMASQLHFLVAPSIALWVICLVVTVWNRRTVRQLRVQQAHLECLFETFPEALMLFGTDGKILRANPRFTAIFGYQVSEALGNNVDALLVPDGLMPEGLSVGERLARGETVAMETRRRRKNGELVEVSFFGAPIQAAGRHVASYGIYHDLTPRRAAEAKARESQQLLELFFAQSLDGFFFMMLDEPIRWDEHTDKDAALEYAFRHHRITRVNDAMLLQYGLTREQMIGLTPADLYAHDLAAGRAAWRRFFDAGRSTDATEERRADGTPIQIEGDYICLYDTEGRIVGHFGIQREVTERHRQERALRQSEEKFERAFRSSPFAMTIATLKEGRFLEVNDAFEVDTGFTRAEAIGRTALELGLWQDPAARLEMVRQIERDGKIVEFTIQARNRRGEPRVNVLWGERITVGQDDCILAITSDITDRKRAEEALRRSRRDLRNLAARLQTVREEERTRIARELHDELGQALTGLKLDLAWIKGQIPRPKGELAERLQQVIGRVDGTVDQVRRIATELRPGVLDLLGLVAAIEWQAQEFSRRSGVMTDLDLHSDQSPVEDTRATTVFRILQEALNNVARHAAASLVRIAFSQTSQEIRLEVVDNGRGITAEELAGSRSLGLVGIRERAIACGGDLDIAAGASGGTTVRVYIPCQPTGTYEVIT
jgi:PAS domain S-box-containing protein